MRKYAHGLEIVMVSVHPKLIYSYLNPSENSSSCFFFYEIDKLILKFI